MDFFFTFYKSCCYQTHSQGFSSQNRVLVLGHHAVTIAVIVRMKAQLGAHTLSPSHTHSPLIPVARMLGHHAVTIAVTVALLKPIARFLFQVLWICINKCTQGVSTVLTASISCSDGTLPGHHAPTTTYLLPIKGFMQF